MVEIVKEPETAIYSYRYTVQVCNGDTSIWADGFYHPPVEMKTTQQMNEFKRMLVESRKEFEDAEKVVVMAWDFMGMVTREELNNG